MPDRAPHSLVVVPALTQLDKEACLAIRLQVFVEEQGVPEYLEMDEHDSSAIHYLVRADATPIATARLLSYSDSTERRIAKIGRVAVVASFRRRGVGSVLMEAVLRDARARGFSEAVLDSQTYAMSFYQALGFVAEGDEFLEAGIAHYRMRRRL